MPLPEFDIRGDLPKGVYRATLDEILTRFGHGTPQRELATARLSRLYELAQGTGKLFRFIIFGSYVTLKSNPNDVDILLVMRDDFNVAGCDEQTQLMFDHLRAPASFWSQHLFRAPFNSAA